MIYLNSHPANEATSLPTVRRDERKYLCCNERRREAVRALLTLKGIDFNGIDYLEVPDALTLRVHFIHPLVTERTETLHTHALSKDNVSITGGERIRDVAVVKVSVVGEQHNVLLVTLNKAGDRSAYTLLLKPDAHILKLDPQLSEVDFNFNDIDSIDPHNIDCKTAQVCQPELAETPEIDYLARDFASFRQLMLDRLTLLMPQWNERSAADIGVMLVEILAYVGDHLSYQQDVIATESYLSTARRRISVRRHARLLDYFISEGCNARAWVQVQVNQDMVRQPCDRQSPLPAGTQLLTRVVGQDAALLDAPAYMQAITVQAPPEVFETMYDVDGLFKDHNEISFYTWGARECCLPKGATHATLGGRLERLLPGDVLIFKEVLGARTGAPEDAEPAHRHAVRLTSVTVTQDPLGTLSTQAHAKGKRIEEEIRVVKKERLVEETTIKRGHSVTREEHSIEETRTTDEERVIEDGRVIEDQIKEEEPIIVEEDEDTQDLPVIRTELRSEHASHRDSSARKKDKGRPRKKKAEREEEEVVVEEPEEERHTEAITKDSAAGEMIEEERTEDETIKRAVEAELVEGKGRGVERVSVLTETETVEKEDIKKEKEADYSLDITEIEWHFEDALPFPLCISTTTDYEHGHQYLENVSIALGNIVLADHGQTLQEVLAPVPPGAIRWVSTSGDRCADQQPIPVVPRFNPSLQYAPLTYTSPYDVGNPPASARAAMQLSAHNAAPAIVLGVQAQNAVVSAKGARDALAHPLTNAWLPKRDLLSSRGFDRHFVAESESDGITYLRFGDDQHGMRPRADISFAATYRVGNGVRGNIGAEGLYHIVINDTRIKGIDNPLPAWGGVEPESIEDVRQKISRAFSTQERGVTPDDYKEIAERHPQISKANAVLRWMGSWYTVFLVVERVGGMPVDDAFKREIRQYMESFRMAGGDLEITSPVYVPLEIWMSVDVQPDYFRNNVKAALLEVFSNRQWPDGERGIFYLGSYSFGQSVYLNPLIVAAAGVPGVASVDVTRFQRQGIPGSGLTDGVLALDWLELARLDNDPNDPERGTFLLNVRDGK